MIAVGTRLGPYEVIAPLGAGGMGEVWKARDTRLERSVAIKVLPAEFAENAQLKMRFEREAKTISQLNHPHICTLYDVGDNYLVMELLEGESLAEKLVKGPLPLDQVLRYGIEIAGALEKAHKAGVIHRDLKPGNIMITKSGAKLLDFGLAKGASVEVTPEAATRQRSLTQEGAIVGTFQYMAPEQLEGKEADARTDIFALGAVLYEMATGKRAFEGKSKASLIASILTAEPQPITTWQPLTPPSFERLVRGCLVKDPDDRWQSAHDVAAELRWIDASWSQAVPEVGVRRRQPEKLPLAVAFVLGLIIAAVAMVVLRSRFTGPRPVTRLTIPLPPDLPLAWYGTANLAISPSGRVVAFIGEHSGITHLCIHHLGSLGTTSVPGTEGATSPFFSPDSRWIGFAAGRYLQKMPVVGGIPQPICEAGEVRGAIWSGDQIIFAMGTTGLWTVPASGGNPRLVSHVNQMSGEDWLAWPEILPGGENVLVGSVNAARSAIVAVSLKSGRRTPVAPEGAGPRYINGYLCFSRSGSLLAVRFDAERLRMIGAPVSLVDEIYTTVPFTSPLYAFGRDGTLVYAGGGVREPRRAFVWVDLAGRTTPISLAPQPYEEPRLSPDGNHVAVTVRANENVDVWNVDLSRNTSTRVTFDPGEDETSIWSRDGLRIAFAASRAGRPRSIYWRRSDGIGGEEQLVSSPIGVHSHMSDFSPDGQFMAYTNFNPALSGDIWVMSMLNGVAQPFLRTPFNERAPRFSPDGRYIAYTSDETGRDEIYVQSFPGAGGKWQVSNEGARDVVWSPTGKELFYRNGDKMMAVDVNTTGSFTAGSPRVLFTGEFVPTRRGEAVYDVTKDGKRFLMLQRDKSSAAPLLVVVLDWFQELQRLVDQ